MASKIFFSSVSGKMNIDESLHVEIVEWKRVDSFLKSIYWLVLYIYFSL